MRRGFANTWERKERRRTSELVTIIHKKKRQALIGSLVCFPYMGGEENKQGND